MVGLQARGARVQSAQDLVAEGYVGKVLSCTMIVSSQRGAPNSRTTGLYGGSLERQYFY